MCATGKSPRLLLVMAAVFFAPLILAPASSLAYDVGEMSIHGYATLQYSQATKNEGEDIPGAPDTTNGAFDMQHYNLLFDIPIMQKLTVRSHIEFDHGTDSERGTGFIILEYAFGEYFLSDALKIRGGKTLTPYGLFNEIHDASPAFLAVSIPEVIYKSFDLGGHSMFPKWNTGLGTLGTFSFSGNRDDIDYVIYVGNGENRIGVNESQFDDNRNKGIGGRIQYSIHDSEYIFGFSAYNGDKAITEDRLAENHTAWLFSAEMALDPINLKVEYASSRLADVTQSAWYIQGAYRIGDVTAYTRYMTLDPDDSINDDDWSTIVGGINYQVNDHMFLKFEWNEHDRGVNNLAVNNAGDEQFGEFRSAVTLFF